MSTFTLSSRPAKFPTLGTVYEIKRGDAVIFQSNSKDTAGTRLACLRLVDALTIPLTLTPRQDTMIRAYLLGMLLAGRSPDQVKFGTAMARSYSGRKPAIRDEARVIVYDADGYSLDMVNGTWEDAA